jgi:hypothetical protein
MGAQERRFKTKDKSLEIDDNDRFLKAIGATHGSQTGSVSAR